MKTTNDNHHEVHHALWELANRVYDALTPEQRAQHSHLEGAAAGEAELEPTDEAVQLYTLLRYVALLANRAYPDASCASCARRHDPEHARAVIASAIAVLELGELDPSKDVH